MQACENIPLKILSEGGGAFFSPNLIWPCLLWSWTELCRGRLEILPGGSIRADNAATLLAKTGARGLHFRAPKLRNRDQAAHPLGSSDTGLHEVTDPEVVRAIRQAVS